MNDPKIDTKSFVAALNFNKVGEVYTTEEVECIIGNLIYKGYIKGYISHERGKVVLRKTGSFQKLSEIQE